MTAPRCKIESKPPDQGLWVWYRTLDRRNGYLAWGPVGSPFNRRRPLHWLVALYVMFRDGERRRQ